MLRILSSYTARSLAHIKSSTIQAINFDMSWKQEKPLYNFSSLSALNNWIVGCDADIGGKSSAYWGQTEQDTALFWGTLSTELPASNPKIQRSGYAGIRSTMLPFTLMHFPRHDVSKFRYLAIRAKGDSRAWWVNIETDGLFEHSLYQHRLLFNTPGKWEVVLIPFRDFVYTYAGRIVDADKHMTMDTERIRTIGFSILRQDGDFSLELDWIKAYVDSLMIDLIPYGRLVIWTSLEMESMSTKRVNYSRYRQE